MTTARPSAGSASDRGRRRHNADGLAVWAQAGGLGVAVADGIGDTTEAAAAAHAAAGVAARAAATGGAVDAVLAAQAGLPADGDAVLVVAALRPGRGEVAWVGDARAYVDDGRDTTQLTSDQTMAAAVRDAGGRPPARWEHVVTQSVRSADRRSIGAVPVPPTIGRLALVTDGVYRQLGRAEIGAILRGARDVAGAARMLTDTALLAGSGDNASATVVEVPLVPALPMPRGDTGPIDEVASEVARNARSGPVVA